MKIVQFIILAAVCGCSFLPAHVFGSDAGFAQILANDSIVASNVFTPNGDSHNPYFEVKSSNSQPVLLKIYTRAGVLIYSFEKKLHTWDGRSQNGEEMANGVYFYTAEIRGSRPKVSKSGFVHLYR